ncbi:MAG: Na+/H+ antiporter subunit E [Acidimicrobiales bacterium]|nr:Na+/H+ antiporter subunit E [Acidimicrobiales bacterium]
MRRVLALAAWGYVVWVILTWTLTLEQLVFGGVVAVAVAVMLAPLGGVIGPWWLFTPRRLLVVVHLIAEVVRRILVANVKLAARIWSPRLPLSSGMVITPTHERGDGGIAAVGIITSLIVDNQITDIDRRRHLFQYHAVAVPPENRAAARRAINGPIEDLLARFEIREPAR